jgi:tetratricopeptide (TPR) repeat protein
VPVGIAVAHAEEKAKKEGATTATVQTEDVSKTASYKQSVTNASGDAAMAFSMAAHAARSPEELISAAKREEKAGAFERAIALYNTFLKDYPDHIQRPAIQYSLALCYDSIGQIEPAIEHLKASVAVPPDKALGKYRPDAFMKLASLYSDCGTNKLKEAADTLNMLLKEGAGLYEDEAQSQRARYATDDQRIGHDPPQNLAP